MMRKLCTLLLALFALCAQAVTNTPPASSYTTNYPRPLSVMPTADFLLGFRAAAFPAVSIAMPASLFLINGQPGNGSGLTNFHATLNAPWVLNATNFGIVGDDFTDNTVQLANALAACGPGRVLYIPKGNYHFHHLALTNGYVTIRGAKPVIGLGNDANADDGTVLSGRGADSFLLIPTNNPGGIVIEDLMFQGTGTNHIQVGATDVTIKNCGFNYCTGTSILALNPVPTNSSVFNLKIEDCSISTATVDGILFDGPVQSRIIGCTIQSCGRAGIETTNDCSATTIGWNRLTENGNGIIAAGGRGNSVLGNLISGSITNGILASGWSANWHILSGWCEDDSQYAIRFTPAGVTTFWGSDMASGWTVRNVQLTHTPGKLGILVDSGLNLNFSDLSFQQALANDVAVGATCTNAHFSGMHQNDNLALPWLPGLHLQGVGTIVERQTISGMVRDGPTIGTFIGTGSGLTNLPVSGLTGGVTGNLTVVTNGADTATIHITNGAIISVTAP